MSIESWSTVVFILALFLLRIDSNPESFNECPDSTGYDWRVVKVFPHDPDAFTQGLIYRDGYLYESTGRKGKSSLRKIQPETGEIIQQIKVESEYFAEGLTDWNEQLIQLTLDSGIGFVYDLLTFEREKTFQVTGEGWGLTNDGDQLIMSDGTSTLRYLDPVTFLETKQLKITENGEPVSKLNELEMIGDRIFANILYSDEIAIIDPEDGTVTCRIDLQHIVSMVEREGSVNVLNGIAYDSTNDRIFITGKMWPKMFEIEILSSGR